MNFVKNIAFYGLLVAGVQAFGANREGRDRLRRRFVEARADIFAAPGPEQNLQQAEILRARAQELQRQGNEVEANRVLARLQQLNLNPNPAGRED